jgi:hypothetical protein
MVASGLNQEGWIDPAAINSHPKACLLRKNRRACIYHKLQQMLTKIQWHGDLSFANGVYLAHNWMNKKDKVFPPRKWTWFESGRHQEIRTLTEHMKQSLWPPFRPPTMSTPSGSCWPVRRKPRRADLPQPFLPRRTHPSSTRPNVGAKSGIRLTRQDKIQAVFGNSSLTRKQASGAPTFFSCMCCLWALLRAQRKTRKIWYSRYLRPKLALAVGVQGASLTRKLVHLFRIDKKTD